MMNVLLISPYSDNLVGGIINWTRYIINYNRIHSEDAEITLLYNERALQVMDSASHLARLRAGLSNYLPVVRKFKKAVKEKHYDVVHICTSASLGLIRDLLVVRAAKKQGLRTVAHMHFGRIPQILNTKDWERMLLLRLVKRVDCVAVMDSASYESLQGLGFSNVRYVPNPLSPDVQKKIEASGNVQRDRRKVVYAGHILPTKGVEELVRACRGINGIKLNMLGKVSDEAYRKQLFSIAGNGAGSWLSILGNKPFNEVITEMKSCGVFVLPSYSEGFPNVILESMACGCPIVATPVGAIPEMLAIDSDEPCGIIVPVKDVDALRTAIERLLNEQKYASSLANNARRRVNAEFAMPKVWKQLVGIWSDASKKND